MSKFLTGIICLAAITSQAQDYIDYQRIISRTSTDILDSNFRSALLRMDTIDLKYDFIYASHCIKGLQLAYLTGDEARAGHWLNRSLIQGTPLWALRSNAITRQALAWPSLQRTVMQCDSLRMIYLSRIDTTLSHHIDRLMARDARYTRKVNNGFFLFRHTLYGMRWIRNNTRQIREIEQTIARYGYPEEKLIGLSERVNDSAELAKFIFRAGIDVTIQNRQAFFMYLHYYSTKRKGINPILWPQVVNGNMPVYQYARLHDYLASTSRHHRNAAFHEFSGLDPNEDTTGLDSRRASIGLPPFAVGEKIRNETYKREFSDRANKEVILD